MFGAGMSRTVSAMTYDRDRDRAERWLRDNAPAMAHANAMIDALGLPLAGHTARATPLRIQDALRDTQPLESEMQPGGAFAARPRNGITVYVAPS